MTLHITLKSSNSKTGKIPVSSTSADSCPKECPFKGSGCYGESGPISWHWSAVNNGKRGCDYNAFLDTIKSLPSGQFWRHNQVGDLVKNEKAKQQTDTIDVGKLRRLVKANKGKRGFTYTHYDVESNQVNRAAIAQANKDGLTVNLSGNNIEHAKRLQALNIGPVVAVVPESYKPTKGIKICPAILDDSINCDSCRICGSANRKSIVVFPAHGAGKDKAVKASMK